MDNSRALKSETIDDLEKHLWLANGAAATISIGFIQAKDVVSQLHYYGAWFFIIGIIMLVIMKFVSLKLCSRDSDRFEDAKSKFDADEVTDMVFEEIRDKTYKVLNKVYKCLRCGAGLVFIIGCILIAQGAMIK